MPHHARETVESIIYARRVPTVALVLALAAAVLHATWNLLVAGSEDTEGATAVALVAGLVVGAPVALLSWNVHASAIPYLAAASMLQLAYIALLVEAYRRADMSVVYPLARGTAPVLVLLVSVVAARRIGLQRAGPRGGGGRLRRAPGARIPARPLRPARRAAVARRRGVHRRLHADRQVRDPSRERARLRRAGDGAADPRVRRCRLPAAWPGAHAPRRHHQERGSRHRACSSATRSCCSP